MKKLLALLMTLLIISLPTAMAAEAPLVLSDDIYDFQVSIDGAVFRFPCSYEDFAAAGWVMDDAADGEEMLSPSSYSMVTLRREDLLDERTITVDFLNMGINTKPVLENGVAGISVDSYYMTEGEVLLAGGIQLGVSSREDIEAAYGSEGQDPEYSFLTYSLDTYRDVTLTMDEETNTLDRIRMSNYIKSESDINDTEVQTEAPAYITDYVVPTELGDDPATRNIEIAGDLYTLPIPLSAFEANGWRVDWTDAGDYIEGYGYAFGGVNLTRDGLTFSPSLDNLMPYAILPEFASVATLSVSNDDEDGLSIALPGGIKIGSTYDELMAACGSESFSDVLERDDYYTLYYEAGETGYEITFTVSNPEKLVTDMRISVPNMEME